MQNLSTFSLDQDRLFTLLNDEQWCISYLFARRWPNGFTCSCCKRMSMVKPTDRQFTCPVCGRAMSITSGTVFHGTKKHLSQWLMALWLLCSRQKVNCRILQNELAIKSYHTAWQWRQKLLAIIEVSNSRKCRGIVETESAALTNAQSADSAPFIIAAKEIRTEPDFAGRLRIDYCSDLSVAAIRRFAEENIEKNSMVIVPERLPYTLLEPGEIRFIPEPGTARLAHTSAIIEQFLKYNTSPSHQGTRSERRLRRRLADFSFQVNKKLFPDTVSLFEHVVNVSLHFRPSTAVFGSKQPEAQRGTA